jgi:hypothetical protein
LAVGCWLLAVGWLLAAVYWLLSIGCCLLAIEERRLEVSCGRTRVFAVHRSSLLAPCGHRRGALVKRFEKTHRLLAGPLGGEVAWGGPPHQWEGGWAGASGLKKRGLETAGQSARPPSALVSPPRSAPRNAGAGGAGATGEQNAQGVLGRNAIFRPLSRPHPASCSDASGAGPCGKCVRARGCAGPGRAPGLQSRVLFFTRSRALPPP